MRKGARGPEPGTPQAKGGGNAVKAKYGVEFYREIGRKGGKVVKERGADFFSEIGRKGGEMTRERHGVEHYSAIGKAGGEASGERARAERPVRPEPPARRPVAGVRRTPEGILIDVKRLSSRKRAIVREMLRLLAVDEED